MGLPILGELPPMPKLPQESLTDKFDWGTPLSTKKHYTNEFFDTGWTGMFHLDKVLSRAIEMKASDIHIQPDQTVCYTINGDIEHIEEFGVPTEQVLIDLMEGLLTNYEQSIYVKDKEFDFSYEIKRGPYANRRLRGNVGMTFGKHFFVFRILDDNIPSIESLGIEKEIVDWMKAPVGLAMICGSTGTGKSTTLASIIRHIQLTEQKKIITIEKPIEYIYPADAKSLIVQREVGQDCVEFYDGLTAAMREAPDMILLGEVRNTEEVSELIRAAETGHMSISTMHTNSVATTINRIQSLFSYKEQKRILSTLADTLQGMANQVLVKDVDGGRFACREILTVNHNIRDMIIDGNVRKIRDYQEAHQATMEWALARATAEGRCTEENAVKQAPFVNEYKEALTKLKRSGYHG